jgi:hypothetical protein
LQCDKENHGWCEGPPLTLAWKRLDLLPGLHPPGIKIQTKKNTAPDGTLRPLYLNIGQ